MSVDVCLLLAEVRCGLVLIVPKRSVLVCFSFRLTFGGSGTCYDSKSCVAIRSVLTLRKGKLPNKLLLKYGTGYAIVKHAEERSVLMLCQWAVRTEMETCPVVVGPG